MKNANARHAYEDGIIEEILYGSQCLVAPHAPHVEVLVEVAPVAVHGVHGHFRHLGLLQAVGELFGLGLWFVGGL